MLIIIVDDEEELHESMKRIIVKKYPEATFEDYYSPRVFLDRLRKRRIAHTVDEISLIILDNLFQAGPGGETGVKALPRIRKQAPQTPILFLTANDNAEELESITQYDMVHYQHKPMEETQFYFKLKEILREQSKTQLLGVKEEEIRELRHSLQSEKNEDVKAQKLYDAYAPATEQVVASADVHDELLALEHALKSAYENLDAKAIKFLASGELLLRHITAKDMDYSPVAIGYAKGVEYIMLKLFRHKGFVDKQTKAMMGEMVTRVYRDKDSWPQGFVTLISAVKDKRNGVAHTNGISRQEAESFRKLLFETPLEAHRNLLAYFSEAMIA